MTPRVAVVLVRHVFRIWRAGQLRFRIETFGLYYPSLPYSSPWWRISHLYARMLLARLTAYAHWVDEMEAIQRRGTVPRRALRLKRRVGS
ncbi:MAG: hypothetical protein NVS4B2_35250 [Chloroflexota bacterium]